MPYPGPGETLYLIRRDSTAPPLREAPRRGRGRGPRHEASGRGRGPGQLVLPEPLGVEEVIGGMAAGAAGQAPLLAFRSMPGGPRPVGGLPGLPDTYAGVPLIHAVAVDSHLTLLVPPARARELIDSGVLDDSDRTQWTVVVDGVAPAADGVPDGVRVAPVNGDTARMGAAELAARLDSDLDRRGRSVVVVVVPGGPAHSCIVRDAAAANAVLREELARTLPDVTVRPPVEQPAGPVFATFPDGALSMLPGLAPWDTGRVAWPEPAAQLSGEPQRVLLVGREGEPDRVSAIRVDQDTGELTVTAMDGTGLAGLLADGGTDVVQLYAVVPDRHVVAADPALPGGHPQAGPVGVGFAAAVQRATGGDVLLAPATTSLGTGRPLQYADGTVAAPVWFGVLRVPRREGEQLFAAQVGPAGRGWAFVRPNAPGGLLRRLAELPPADPDADAPPLDYVFTGEVTAAGMASVRTPDDVPVWMSPLQLAELTPGDATGVRLIALRDPTVPFSRAGFAWFAAAVQAQLDIPVTYLPDRVVLHSCAAAAVTGGRRRGPGAGAPAGRGRRGAARPARAGESWPHRTRQAGPTWPGWPGWCRRVRANRTGRPAAAAGVRTAVVGARTARPGGAAGRRHAGLAGLAGLRDFRDGLRRRTGTRDGGRASLPNLARVARGRDGGGTLRRRIGLRRQRPGRHPRPAGRRQRGRQPGRRPGRQQDDGQDDGQDGSEDDGQDGDEDDSGGGGGVGGRGGAATARGPLRRRRGAARARVRPDSGSPGPRTTRPEATRTSHRPQVLGYSDGRGRAGRLPPR